MTTSSGGRPLPERPLLMRSVVTPNGGVAYMSSTSWSLCRPNCYKILLAIVLVFLLMQFTANFVAFRHKFNISQVLAANSGAQWSQLSLMDNIEGHHLNQHLVQPNNVHNVLATNRTIYGTYFNYSIINNNLLNNNSFKNSDQSVNAIKMTDNVSASASSADMSSDTVVDPIVDFINNTLLTSKSTSSLPLCPLVPPKLVGRLKVMKESPLFEKLEEMMSELESGGRYRPPDCQSRHKMAIVIPYRDREEHLRTFLYNIHPILERQQLDYGIYIVEEVGNGKFNRAKLMNVGFLEALKQYDYQCFIFHDVDLIPEDDRNLYTCPEQPRHMSVAIDKFNYRLPYKDLFGGVSALTTEQFKRINGFSNEFWGWGGEDDDMSNRVRYYGYRITRYSANIARYKMLKHKGDTPNPDRYKKLYSGKRRYKTDGINNIKYKVVDTVFKRLYTWILVDLLSP